MIMMLTVIVNICFCLCTASPVHVFHCPHAQAETVGDFFFSGTKVSTRVDKRNARCVFELSKTKDLSSKNIFHYHRTDKKKKKKKKKNLKATKPQSIKRPSAFLRKSISCQQSVTSGF